MVRSRYVNKMEIENTRRSEVNVFGIGGKPRANGRGPCRGAGSALFALCALAGVATMGARAESDYVVPEWNRAARDEFAAQRFGIFIHWGLYANYAQGEWFLYNSRLDESVYSRMKDGFCPSAYDASEWARIMKASGAKYVTITSRHHDGFSLWPTKVDDGYNIANTPFKRDILGELAAACRKEGIGFNLYYSLMDWHRRDYPEGRCSCAIPIEGRKGDYPSYKAFMIAQIGELIDAYRPGIIWFDGEWEHVVKNEDGTETLTLDWEFDDIYDFIHDRKVLVANNNHQLMRPKEDIQLFERDLPGENESGYSAGQPVARDRPLEQCDVIQKGWWGHRIDAKEFLTVEEAVSMLARAASNDSNLLLNVGPDCSGRFPAKAVATLEGMGRWLAVNGESIYGTRAGGLKKGKGIVSTRKGGTLYLHFLDPAEDEFAFDTKVEFAGADALDPAVKVTLDQSTPGRAGVKIVRPAGNTGDCVVRLVPQG